MAANNHEGIPNGILVTLPRVAAIGGGHCNPYTRRFSVDEVSKLNVS